MKGGPEGCVGNRAERRGEGGIVGGLGGGKKYKNGTMNWQNFSWKEPTGKDGGLKRKKK